MIWNKKIRHMTSWSHVTSLWRHHRFWWSKMLMSAVFWPLTPMICIFSERGLQNIKNAGSNLIRVYFVEKLWRNPILTDFDDVITIVTSLWRHNDLGWDKFSIIVNLRPKPTIPPSFITNGHVPDFFWWGGAGLRVVGVTLRLHGENWN